MRRKGNQRYMNQPKEERQDSRKQKKCGQLSVRKKRAITAVIIALAALLAVPVLAWLYIQRSMETMTKVNMPYAIKIGAGDTQSIQQMELSNIDVSGGAGSKDVVFCVYSDKEAEYYLQLAHTTNIGFQYTIYKASLDNKQGTIDYLGNKYTQGDKLAGSYLNKAPETRYYHAQTYGNYENVQTSAEPLYWRSMSQETLPAKLDRDEYCVNYYILRISWGKEVQNNKETDMIYIMAG